MIETVIQEVPLQFYSAETVFAPKNIDRGTLAMLSLVDFTPEDKVLDLGCGYGVFGIYAAKLIGAKRVVMVDNDPVAVELAIRNAGLNRVSGIKIQVSEGFTHLDDAGFTVILSNPPYHSDFAVAKHFIEKGFNRLKIGGRFYMVTKRCDWYRNKLSAIFGGVQVREIDNYFVFMSIRKTPGYAGKKAGR
jgi:16S rRNA (guanine1207-N2)-methyltransferase